VVWKKSSKGHPH